jgi:dehydrogenase/reductase SDR family member 12
VSGERRAAGGADVIAPRDVVRGLAQGPLLGALGYQLHRRRWDPRELEVDLRDRICLVTGASGGVGLAVARGLATRRATVVLVCRDPARGAAAVREVRAAAGHDRVHVELADLSSLEAVRALAARLRERFPRVHVLVNNVAATFLQRESTPDGLDRTFATNVLGGYHVTRLLLPRLLAAAPSRIIHVGSAVQYFHRLDMDALVSPPNPYVGETVYGHSKRAVGALNRLWVERLEGTAVSSNCMHPGLVATPGVAHTFPRYHWALGRLLRDTDQGADTALWLAASPAGAASHADLWFDRERRPEHVFRWSRAGREESERLWAHCASLCELPESLFPVVDAAP